MAQTTHREEAFQHSSGANQFTTPPLSDRVVHLYQPPEEGGKGLLDPGLSIDSIGDLDLEFSRSFIPEITSVFNAVTLSWDDDGHTAPQPVLERGMHITHQPATIDMADMTNFVPLSSDEIATYSAEALEPTDSAYFCTRAMDLSTSSREPNRGQSVGGSNPDFMPKSLNPDTFHPVPPINLAPKVGHRTSAMYLNEYGTIDQKKDQLEPFRRLFQLDNTSENNQLISLAIERKHEIREIMLAGFRAINSHANSSEQARNLLSSPFLADPYKNNLRLVRVATLDAYLSNALALGMDLP